MPEPYVVRIPAVSKRSLTASVLPASGPFPAGPGSTVVTNALYRSSITTPTARAPSAPVQSADRPVLELEPLVDPVRRPLAADPRLLDSTERRNLGRDQAGVDSDDAVLERLSHTVHATQSLRIEVRGKAVGRVVRDPDCLVLGREASDSGHRAERLLAAHGHVRGDVDDHRRLEELALDPLAAHDDLGAVTRRVRDVALDLLDRRLVDERADVDALREAVRDLELPHGLGKPDEEVVVDPRLDEHPVGRDARLTRVAVLARDRARDRSFEVRVVEDDERRVPAELERDLLEAGRALRHEELPDLGRAREPELANERAR